MEVANVFDSATVKKSQFRHWCYEKWLEHCDEMVSLGMLCDRESNNSQKYFQMYKWWLKREFKHYMDSNG